ncbi:MAG: hypothetical protein RBS88_07575 [Spongiibacteraceae bacterium]|jgi:hypothetical protein|nr:hypothetical protein [Spongiibacteraceae bacterium]
MNKLLIAATALMFTAGAYAAKPTSITYVKEVPLANDEIYAEFVVKCSDGQEKSITAWDNRRTWCQGTGERTDCTKKQINAAKEACK